MAAPKPDKKLDFDFGLDWDADILPNKKLDFDFGLDWGADILKVDIDDGLEDFKIDFEGDMGPNPMEEIELLKNMDLGLDSDPFKLPVSGNES
ncbi:MAG TPA: hypothetical protein EYN96_07195 [Candidatus Hydrogenedentes bacterium]|nr:hypothetical protein [Candidatus Hydrogenedentota bacterium]